MRQLTENHGDRWPEMSAYDITDQIHAGRSTVVYRGSRRADAFPVVLKRLKDDAPSLSDQLRLRNHYTIAKTLNFSGITSVLNLEPDGHSWVLVMPDEGYQSLADYLTTHALNLSDCLAIAIQLTDILHYLYQQRVIHKDIKPANILIHPETKQIQLTDFSIASLLPKETEAVKHPNVLEGTLAYLAPEQTGRMNRGIDYRSDFYSLGVTLYELLTGHLPFQRDDPLELVYCHLAEVPIPPHQISNPIFPVPYPLSQIVLKLMAKNAEDRYQSTLGLKADLGTCLEQYQATGDITNFCLGQVDDLAQFNIPQTLYGRERAVQTLIAAFDRVSQGGHELVVVSGGAGVGKTAFVNEILRQLTRCKGYFAVGKFEQLQQNVPLMAVMQAYRNVIQQLLTEPPERLQYWRDRFRAYLGSNAQLIIDMLPDLELIIGPQPPVPELGGIETTNRLVRTFNQFTQALQSAEHPRVAFMDDVQWSDHASFQSLQAFMANSANRHSLMIIAYRENEVSRTHPVSLMLTALRQVGAKITEIHLEPLGLDHVTQLVADTLHQSPQEETVVALAQLLFEKTAGNPFFLVQLLKSLHEDGVIWFDSPAIGTSPLHGRQPGGQWQWHLEPIQQQQITDNVVNLMISQVTKLSAPTQRQLQLAACIGNTFDLQTLATVSERSLTQTARELWAAVLTGLIVPIGPGYRIPQVLNDVDFAAIVDSDYTISYRFLHDRLQQAAYSLIPDDRKAITHYHIGQLLLRQIPPAAQEEHIFELVSQLNHGTDLIPAQPERDELARLNLMASRKARAATAFQASQNYVDIGLALLGENAWQRQYETTLAFYNLAAELAALDGDVERVEQFFNTVIDQSHSLLDQVTVYCLRIQSRVSLNKPTQAVAIGCQFLEKLGVAFPETATPQNIQDGIAQISHLIGDLDIEALVHLPSMTDRETRAIVQIANSILPAAHISSPALFPLLVALPVRLSIQSGNTNVSAHAYACYGNLACNLLRDVETGMKFGQLALQLLSRPDAKAFKPDVIVIVGAFLWHRKAHLKETLPLLQEGYAAALEVGNLEFLGYIAHIICLNSLWCAQPLATIEQETRSYCKTLVQFHQLTTANYCRISWQTTLNLSGLVEPPTLLSGEAMDEVTLLRQLRASHDLTGLNAFYSSKLMLCYLFGDLESAKHYAREIRRSLAASLGFVLEPALYFYESLTALAALKANSETAAAVLAHVDENQTQLQQHWAQFAPMNYQHKVDLVAAELHRVLDQPYKAGDRYDRAIAGAQKNGYLQEAALANELAAKFYLAWGKPKVAAGYLQDAYEGYARWGAKAKTDDLKHRYADLLLPLLTSSSGPRSSQEATTTQNVGDFSTLLDLETILKASQTLSSKIEFDQLLQTLIQLVVANAGADKAVLLLEHDGALQAVINYADRAIQPLEPPSANEAPLFSTALVQYVERTLTTVITDYRNHPSTVNDPYCRQFQPQSLLCTPMLKQGQLVGVLYLENAIAANVFTDERVELLKVLCAQAAISLENARLYQQSQSYAQQLERSLQDLSISEARLQTLSNNIPGVIFQICIDPEGGSTSTPYVSSGCYSVYGVQAEAVMSGKYDLRDFEHPDDRSKLTQAIRQSAETLIPFQEEFRIITHQGQMKWIQVVSQPIKDADGLITWDGVLLDISDRKRLEQEQAKLTTILESASDYISTADPEGNTHWFNQHFRQLLPDPSPRHIANVHPAWASEMILQQGLPTARAQGTWLGETAVLNLKTGQEIPVSQLIIAHKSVDGEVEFYSTIMRDISDRKAAEAQLQQQAQQLEAANRQLAEYSQTLEQKVDERTQALSEALTFLKNAQQDLIQSEKMAVLGQLTASIAHEINTPLGVIRGASENMRAAFQATVEQLPALWQQLSPQQQTDFLALLQVALQQPQSLSTKEERQLRRQLQAALTAQGLAPAPELATQLMLLRLGPDLHPYHALLQAPNGLVLLQAAYHLVLQHHSTDSIQQEVDRAAKIVFALKTYSHHTDNTERCQVNLVEGLELALTLYHNRLKRGITVLRRYAPELPEVVCNPEEMTQVWVNLIDNALHAMGPQGTLAIAVTPQAEHVVVTITDSGQGIPDDLQARIFEPFFTTKARGEGSGLGLDIVRQIVQKHGGTIQVQSQPGCTTFTISLPIATLLSAGAHP
jgi:PAS domain S-box-containing protein